MHDVELVRRVSAPEAILKLNTVAMPTLINWGLVAYMHVILYGHTFLASAD